MIQWLDNSRKSRQIQLIAIFWLSWMILLWQLGERALWHDEYGTLWMSRGNWSEVLRAAALDIHPPLYFLVLHGWMILTGSSDFALRFFSVIWAMMGIALMVPVSRWLIGPRSMIWAALFLGMAPALIAFSRMARYYSLILMFGLLSTYFFLRAIRQLENRFWLGYIGAGLALIYTFYPAGILIVIHGLMGLQLSRKILGRWVISAFSMGLGFVPWFILVTTQHLDKLAGKEIGAYFSRSVIGFVLGIGASFYTFGVGETFFPWRPEVWPGLIIVLGLFAIGLWKQWQQGRWQLLALFLGSIIFISLVATFISVGTPFLNVPVRGLFALPYFLLIVVAGLVSVPSTKWRGVLATILLIVWGLGTLNNFVGQQFLNPIYITPTKAVAKFLDQNALPADTIINDHDVLKRYLISEEPRYLETFQMEEIEKSLQSEQSKPTRIWLVTLQRDQTRFGFETDIRDRLQQEGYQLQQREGFLPIDPIYLKAKNFVLGRSSYEYRMTVELYISNKD